MFYVALVYALALFGAVGVACTLPPLPRASYHGAKGLALFRNVMLACSVVLAWNVLR